MPGLVEGILKIRAEINAKETKQTIAKINKVILFSDGFLPKILS